MALKNALIEKEIAVDQAIKVRNMQDQADNQVELAKATVGNQAATENSAKIKKLADASLFMKAKISWYKGDNIPGKPKVFIPYPGGLPRYRNICNKVEKNQYKDFLIK